MNDTYINYIDQLLDLAECNDIFHLTSRAFNEFAIEVRETLSKEKEVAPDIYPNTRFHVFECSECGIGVTGVNRYCHKCGQKFNWED